MAQVSQGRRGPAEGARRATAWLGLALLGLAGAVPGAAGCARAEVSPTAVLHARFAAHAERVLGVPGTLVSAPLGGRAGFAPAPPAMRDPEHAARAALVLRRGLRAWFPTASHQAVRLSLRDGFTVTVREAGLRGSGRLAGGAVVYRRSAGDESAFWTSTDQGYEEWLLVGPGRPGAPVATWEVGGGTLRRRGTTVEVLDASGRPRLAVRAPAAYSSTGVSIPARLATAGTRLALYVASPADDPGPLLVDPLWEAVGDFATARAWHTATLLPTGKVLVAGGWGAGQYLRDAEVYDPGTGLFTPTENNLATGRYRHTATLLPTGQVLIAGGGCDTDETASAELFDPVTNRFTSAGTLITPRQRHTATLLASGKVLVAAGTSAAAGDPITAELYDPASDTFTLATGSMGRRRYAHTATLLPDGKVLIAGGADPNGGLETASAEVYDPATSTFSATTAPLGTARYDHTATLLPDGKVLVAGGRRGNDYLASAELYDPAARTFAPVAAPLAVGRTDHTATLLPAGTVLLTGGTGDTGDLAAAEVFDPVAGTFTATSDPLVSARYHHAATLLPSGDVLVTGGYWLGGYLAAAEVHARGGAAVATGAALATARGSHTATLLPSGKVLIAGGRDATQSFDSAELFDPATRTVAAAADALTTPRSFHTATVLPTGKVLLAGGRGGSATPTGELYDPATGTFSATTGAMVTERSVHTATLLPSGRVLLAGGQNWAVGGILDSAEEYDPLSDGFTATVGHLGTPRQYHTATLLPSGRVLIVGGSDGNGMPVASCDLYDPEARTFAPTTMPLPTARMSHTATLLPSGEVLIVGGCDFSTCPATALLYRDASGSGTFTFDPTGALHTPRLDHTATLLPSGKVLIAGGTDLAGDYAPPELYDPATGTFTLVADAALGARVIQTATLLQTGEVLLAGGADDWGHSDVTELYDEARGASPSWTPTLAAPTAGVAPGGALTLTGTLFTGVSEGSSGTTGSAAGNAPLVLLWRQDSQALTYAPTSAASATGVTATVPPGTFAGPHVVWVVTNGVLSNGRPLTVTAGPLGTSCAADPECGSRHCVDGVCCASRCDTACRACNVAGHEGTCTELPVLAEDAVAAVPCVAPQACDGAGACRLANGQSCTAPTQCASGFCANGVCCESACAGTCQVCGAGGLCGGCASDRYCDGSACVPKLALAATCDSDSQCQSDHCADGVCCATACQGNCEICNSTGNVGQCWPVPNGTDPKLKCQAAAGGHPSCAGTCQARQCTFPDVGTTCGLCAACDGTGRCTAVPADDPACGTISCGGLDTACRAYADLTANRCASLGSCRADNDPAGCTSWTDLPCADGGTAADGGPVPVDGGTPGAGAGSGGGGCSCAVTATSAPGAALLLGLPLLVRRRRRPTGARSRRR